MKFNLPNQEIQFDSKQQSVHLPLKRFTELMNYVEDIESKLLAAEINLREVDHLASSMEQTLRGAPQPPFSPEIVERVQQTLSKFPTEVSSLMRDRGISIRKLALMTSIPYATLYRYVAGQTQPNLQKAARIMDAVSAVSAEIECVSDSEDEKVSRGMV